MRTLLCSGFAILVACWVVAPERVAAHFDTPAFRTAKAELAADRPTEKLWRDIKTWLDDTRASR